MQQPKEEALSVRNMNYRICLWVFLTASISLACFLLVLSAVIVNYAPYRAVVAMYWCALALYMFAMLALPLIFKFCYSTQSIEGDYEKLETITPMHKRREFSYAVMSFVLCFIVLIAVMFCLTVIFPQSFHPTSDFTMIRVASVSHTHAVLFVRLPKQTHATLQVGKDVMVTIQVELELDYTKFVTVRNLLPSTTYNFSLLADENTSRYEGRFTTFPLPSHSSKFSFYFGGKYMPHFPNFGMDQGWEVLHDQLEAATTTTSGFILFLGDIISAQHPWYQGNTLQAYASHYRQTLRNAQRTLARFPSFFMYGEQDIFTTKQDSFAMQTWDVYLGGGNPQQQQQQQQRYYTFDHDDVSFFVLDTIAHRERNATMLGSKQKLDLLAWLHNTTAKFKFLASPVPWTRALDEDMSWDFASQERNDILEYIRTERISGCVFLSMNSQMIFSKAELGFQGSNMFEFGSSVLSAPTKRVTFPWRRRRGANETKPKFWHSLGGSFSSTMAIVDVDTTLSDPELQIKFYVQNEIVHVETLRLSELQPGTQAPTQTPIERNNDDDDGDDNIGLLDEEGYEYDEVFE